MFKFKKYAVVIHTANASTTLSKLFPTYRSAVAGARKAIHKHPDLNESEVTCIDLHCVPNRSTPLSDDTMVGFIL